MGQPRAVNTSGKPGPAAKLGRPRDMPWDKGLCAAHTPQGAIAHAPQQNLTNEFRRYGMDKDAVTLICQSEVAPDDPAFNQPTKPIGSFMDAAQAQRRHRDDGWLLAEDANRGYRWVVASPLASPRCWRTKQLTASTRRHASECAEPPCRAAVQ